MVDLKYLTPIAFRLRVKRFSPLHAEGGVTSDCIGKGDGVGCNFQMTSHFTLKLISYHDTVLCDSIIIFVTVKKLNGEYKMQTIIKPQTNTNIDELTSDEVRLSSPKIMQYLKEGIKSETPEFIVILGPVGAGKTNYIKNNYGNGYVWIDMARIFFELQKETGIRLNRRKEIINFIGLVTLDLAILEKRNIVVELIGDELEKVEKLINVMKSAGYDVKVTELNSSDDTCFPGAAEKNDEYMSSLYTESFHLSWFDKIAA